MIPPLRRAGAKRRRGGGGGASRLIRASDTARRGDPVRTVSRVALADVNGLVVEPGPAFTLRRSRCSPAATLFAGVAVRRRSRERGIGNGIALILLRRHRHQAAGGYRRDARPRPSAVSSPRISSRPFARAGAGACRCRRYCWRRRGGVSTVMFAAHGSASSAHLSFKLNGAGSFRR